MTLWNGLVQRFCPTLDDAGNNTATVTNLDGVGVAVGVNNAAWAGVDPLAIPDRWFDNDESPGLRSFEFLNRDYERIECGNLSSLNTTDLTVACWVYYYNTASYLVGRAIIVPDFTPPNYTNTIADNGWLFEVTSNGSLQFNGRNDNISSYLSVSSVSGVITSGWQHVAVVKSGSSVTLYRNGVSVGSGTFTATFTSNDMQLGGVGTTDLLVTNSRLDDICIFNVAKSSSDIISLSSERGLIYASNEVVKISTVPTQVVGTNKRTNVSHLGVEVLGDMIQTINTKTTTVPTQVVGTNKRTNVTHLGVEILGDMVPPSFTSLWKTDNPGFSNSNQIKLPLISSGTYNFTVNWGDSTTDTITSWNQAETTHTYASPGTYTVTISGTITGWAFGVYGNGNASTDRRKILNISDWGTFRLTDNSLCAFEHCSNLTITAPDDTLDMTGVTGMVFTWYGCSSLTSFPLIDTSNVTSMYRVWGGCSGLTSFPFIDTSSATSISENWLHCSGLTSFPSIDTSNVTNFSSAWSNCSSLTSFPLIDTSSGINFNGAWGTCSSLTSFPLLDVSSGTTFVNTWGLCSGLTSFPLLDISSGINFSGAWSNCTGLTSFPLLDTSSGTNFNHSWANCTDLTSFPLIDTSNGTTFRLAWSECPSLTSFPLIDTSNGTDFHATWLDCTGLASFPLLDFSSAILLEGTWSGCSGLTSFPLIDTSNVTSFAAPIGGYASGAWGNCTSLTSFPPLDVSSGTNFRFTWKDCIGLTEFPVGFGLNLGSMTIGDRFLENTNFTITAYSRLLEEIESVNSNNNVQIGFTPAFYNDTNGIMARTALINDHNWTIFDYGLEGEMYDETASGGVEVGGRLFSITNEISSGGARLSGLSKIDYNIFETSSEGILVGGKSIFVYDEISSDGVEVGGKSIFVYDETSSSGVLISGNASLGYSEIASGGIQISGTVNEEFIKYVAGVKASGIAEIFMTENVTDVLPVENNDDDGYWTPSIFNAVDPVVFVGNENQNELSLGAVKAFFRFRNMPIPVGSKITSAVLNLETAGNSGGTAVIRIHGNASDNALAPTTILEANNKALTIANSGNWTVPGTSTSGVNVSSPDLSDAIQEVVDRPNWRYGNAVMLLAIPVTVSGNNFQTFKTVESDNLNLSILSVDSPITLTITYTSGAIYSLASSGGVEVGGSVLDEFHQGVSGGILADGESVVSPVERYFGDGGILASGDVEVFKTSDIEFVGGVNLGGDSLISVFREPLIDAFGTIIAGDSLVQSGLIASGGIDVGSSALINFYDHVEEVLDGEGAILSGRAILEVKINTSTSGGFVIGGSSSLRQRFKFISSGRSADTPPDNAGISIGYRNSENPTIVNFGFSLDRSFNWGVDKSFTLDTGLYWNTGRLPLYFYRIVGKPRFIDECDPIEGIGECCKQFVMNVPARSITDLCEILRKRRWKWPVKTVEKFSRNAESNLITEEDENCNILTPIEICNNVVCEEFCIDYDLRERWGFTSKTQVNAFKTHVATGTVVTSGTAPFVVVADFNYSYNTTGGLTTSGEGVYLSNFIAGGGSALLGGTAFNESSAWYYIGGEWPFGRYLEPLSFDQFIETPSDRNWANPEFIKNDNDSRATADTTGGQATKYLVAKGFQNNLPSNAKIIGIEVTIDRNSTGSVRDNAVYLVNGDTIISDNMASSSLWPIGVDAPRIYGGIGEFWRNPDDIDYLGEWEIEDINSPDFGVAIRVEPTLIQLSSESSIDSIQLKVYWEEQDQHLKIGGEAITRNRAYSYKGNGVLLITGEIKEPIVGKKYKSDGRGSIGPAFSAITTGGVYSIQFVTESSGSINIGGTGQLNSGIISSGTAKISTSSNFYTSTGELALESLGTHKLNLRFNTSGGISINGISGFNNVFKTGGSGGLTVSGNSKFKSSAFNFVSDGNVLFAFGDADIKFSDVGTLEVSIGFTTEVRDVAIVWEEDFDQDIVLNDPVPNDLITACQCAEMELVMPMIHNLARNNKFAQFLQRNNYGISRVLGLKWSRINDSWITNQTFEGFGADVPDKELWTLIFQLHCTNNIGGSILDFRVWKFSMQIIQKNLRTFADYDTRLVVSFLPDLICTSGDFDVTMDIDTQSRQTMLTPSATVYDFKLHDNIGLFKNQYWLENPVLKLQLSQTGIDELVARYPLIIT